MSALRDILDKMYVEDELLAQLDDEQKQILFIKMREEQVRRWHAKEAEYEAQKETPKKKKNDKRIQWLKGRDGEVWVWVMGDHPDDPSIDAIIADEVRAKARRMAAAELAERAPPHALHPAASAREAQLKRELQQMRLGATTPQTSTTSNSTTTSSATVADDANRSWTEDEARPLDVPYYAQLRRRDAGIPLENGRTLFLREQEEEPATATATPTPEDASDPATERPNIVQRFLDQHDPERRRDKGVAEPEPEPRRSAFLVGSFNSRQGRSPPKAVAAPPAAAKPKRRSPLKETTRRFMVNGGCIPLPHKVRDEKYEASPSRAKPQPVEEVEAEEARPESPAPLEMPAEPPPDAARRVVEDVRRAFEAQSAAAARSRDPGPPPVPRKPTHLKKTPDTNGNVADDGFVSAKRSYVPGAAPTTTFAPRQGSPRAEVREAAAKPPARPADAESAGLARELRRTPPAAELGKRKDSFELAKAHLEQGRRTEQDLHHLMNNMAHLEPHLNAATGNPVTSPTVNNNGTSSVTGPALNHMNNVRTSHGTSPTPSGTNSTVTNHVTSQTMHQTMANHVTGPTVTNTVTNHVTTPAPGDAANHADAAKVSPEMLRLRAAQQRLEELLPPQDELEKRQSQILEKLLEEHQRLKEEAELEAERERLAHAEQERKSREAEAQIRSIAQRAREQHERNLRTSTALLPMLKKTDSSDSKAIREAVKSMPRPPKPKDRSAIVRWFRQYEQPAGTGVDRWSGRPFVWFHGIVAREAADALLAHQPPGAFLVRVSERIWGYTVSYVVGGAHVKHFLVEKLADGYQFLGTNQTVHPSLQALVDYHETRPITSRGQELLLYPVGQTDAHNPNYRDLFDRLPVEMPTRTKAAPAHLVPSIPQR